MELNRLHNQALIKLINSAPFFQNLSMAIEDMGIGYSVVKIALEEKHLSPYGAIQGGVYSSIIDTALTGHLIRNCRKMLD
jgi:acyl-coenzyme A thioesterase PaaI-like protein